MSLKILIWILGSLSLIIITIMRNVMANVSNFWRCLTVRWSVPNIWPAAMTAVFAMFFLWWKKKRPELLIGDLLQERQILFLPGMTSFRRVKNRNYGFMISIVLPEYLISRKKSIVFNPWQEKDRITYSFLSLFFSFHIGCYTILFYFCIVLL